jgi:endo-1,4-beta-xylanase
MLFAIFCALGQNNAPPAEPEARKAGAAAEKPIQWVNEPVKQYLGVHHHTYFSNAVKTQVGYNIYLPPDYETSAKRYPVLWYLHGAGDVGNENRRTHIAEPLDAAIRSGKTPPMIVVFPNGLGFSFWSNSADGQIPVETMVLKELMPLVERTYRIIATREARAIQGMSMGGFGALKLAFKYPELFCSVIGYGPALLDADALTPGRTGSLARMFNNDPTLYHRDNPFELVRQNADRIRENLPVRMVIGGQDRLLQNTDKMHTLLNELKIPHDYFVYANVGHDLLKLLGEDNDGIQGFLFAGRHFRAR